MDGFIGDIGEIQRAIVSNDWTFRKCESTLNFLYLARRFNGVASQQIRGWPTDANQQTIKTNLKTTIQHNRFSQDQTRQANIPLAS